MSARFGRRSERFRRRTDTEEAYAAQRGGCGHSTRSRRTSRSRTARGFKCAREQHPAAGKAGACDRLGMLSGCRAAGASHPIALGARERYGRVCGAVCAEGSAGMFHGPVLRARVRSCADERAGGGLEALPALETRMAGTSGSGLRGMQVWARGSAVPRVCGGCPTAARSGT
jgi:hypothetical protein